MQDAFAGKTSISLFVVFPPVISRPRSGRLGKSYKDSKPTFKNGIQRKGPQGGRYMVLILTLRTSRLNVVEDKKREEGDLSEVQPRCHGHHQPEGQPDSVFNKSRPGRFDPRIESNVIV